VTGSKVFCCHANVATGSVRSPLEAAPQFTRYAAFWDKSSGPAWQARHGLSSAQYQQEFDRLSGQGYRLVEVSGYSVDDKDTYAAIWEQRPGPAWQARHGLTSAQYQQEFDRLASQGYRPVDVSGYTVAGQDHYAAIWEQRPSPAWQARHGLTSAQYQQEFDRLMGQGYRLVDVSGYSVNGQDRYAAIWEQSQGPAWQARHAKDPTESDFYIRIAEFIPRFRLQLREFERQAGKHFVLTSLGHPDLGATLSLMKITDSDSNGPYQLFGVRIDAECRQDLAAGVDYTIRPVNTSEVYKWTIKQGLVLHSPKAAQ